jgi:hypothetical protein
VIDHGAKALSAIASLIPSRDDGEIGEVAKQIVDPIGTFYRYSLPASLLHRRVASSAPGPSEPVGAATSGGAES